VSRTRTVPATRAAVEQAMKSAANFMDVGRTLTEARIAYSFSTEMPMPPLFRVTIAGATWFIVNSKHADDGSFTVNGIALTQ
jgi:hypothetical protein